MDRDSEARSLHKFCAGHQGIKESNGNHTPVKLLSKAPGKHDLILADNICVKLHVTRIYIKKVDQETRLCRTHLDDFRPY